MLGASEVAYILDNAGACGVSVEDALSAIADAAIVEAGITLKVRGAIREQHANTPAGWECVQAWMQHANTDAPDVGVGDDEPVQMLYTRGTESRPKGVLLSARSLSSHYPRCTLHGEMRNARNQGP